jgi:hypothetical protein
MTGKESRNDELCGAGDEKMGQRERGNSEKSDIELKEKQDDVVYESGEVAAYQCFSSHWPKPSFSGAGMACALQPLCLSEPGQPKRSPLSGGDKRLFPNLQALVSTAVGNPLRVSQDSGTGSTKHWLDFVRKNPRTYVKLGQVHEWTDVQTAFDTAFLKEQTDSSAAKYSNVDSSNRPVHPLPAGCLDGSMSPINNVAHRLTCEEHQRLLSHFMPTFFTYTSCPSDVIWFKMHM